jgi:hypothetical protein
MGYQVFTSGWFHLLVFEFSWLANFAFWFVVWQIWSRRQSRRALIIGATILGLLTLQSAEMFVFFRFFEFPRPFAGYFLWVAANLLIVAVALIEALRNDRNSSCAG